MLLEEWTYPYRIAEENEEAEKRLERKKNRRYRRFLKAARKILIVEAWIIFIEFLFRFGGLIRGHNSIGGEGLLLIVIAGFAVWQFRKIAE